MIEKGIPVPEPIEREACPVRIADLKKGQSVVLSYKGARALAAQARYQGIETRTRKVEEDEYRVWRVSA